MREYRIKKEVTISGKEIYYVQYRDFLIWHTYGYSDWEDFIAYKFCTEKEAIEAICRQKKDYEDFKIKESYIIPLDCDCK